MTLGSVLDRTTVAMVVCGVVVGILGMVNRANHQPRIVSTDGSSPELARDIERNRLDAQVFRQLAESGMRVGPADAAVTIVVFNDYACGACAQFHPALEAVRERYPGHVAIIYKHYQPSWNRHTLQLAQAAECASAQGVLASFNSVMFSAPEERLVTDRWGAVGRRSGVPDLEEFNSCIRDGRAKSHVLRDTEQAGKVGVSGTPASFVNGIPVRGAVPLEALNTLIGSELDRRPNVLHD